MSFSKFMPESPSRKLLVWKAARLWDAEKTLAFLTEHHIDPHEMSLLDRDAD